MAMIEALLRLAINRNASDLHIGANLAPVLRINGNLIKADENIAIIDPTEAEAFATELTSPVQYARFEEQGEVDFAYSLFDPDHNESNRFRINLYRNMGMINLAIRLLPRRIPSVFQLGLPEEIRNLARLYRGLVIVSGQTGSGKSTTLAALIDQINKERHCHIVTLEDPIEYVHAQKLSVIHQREVYSDTASFSSGLRAALRQDPNVILVGEMRDNETIAAAITAAETGHLVLATLHTGDA
ncbi:MAG: type IV pilus twitching motility protein PilT, partial [Sporomusa sp.]